jgi:hypothetical protein
MKRKFLRSKFPDPDMEAIVAAVSAIEPDLDRQVILDAVSTTAPSRRQLCWLDQALAQNPECLALGASSLPLVVAQLIRRLAGGWGKPRDDALLRPLRSASTPAPQAWTRTHLRLLRTPTARQALCALQGATTNDDPHRRRPGLQSLPSPGPWHMEALQPMRAHVPDSGTVG